MATAAVILHRLANDAALGMENSQTGADLIREREQIQLGAEASVVSLLGLLKHGQVVSHIRLRRPSGAVNPLQLGILLAAPPVSSRGAHQLECVARDVAGVWHVGAAA